MQREPFRFDAVIYVGKEENEMDVVVEVSDKDGYPEITSITYRGCDCYDLAKEYGNMPMLKEKMEKEIKKAQEY